MRRLLQALLLALLAALLCGRAAAQDVLPVPALTARVIDQTGTLGAAQRQALEERLAAFEREAGTQLVILMVPSTAPEDIASYAQRIADTWKLGRRDAGDGLLLVVAKNDRRVRIEVAKTLEGAIPDLAAKRVIDRDITPAFRAGDFAGGLRAAVDELAALVRAEKLPAPASAPDGWAGSTSGPQQRGGAAEQGLQLQDLGLFFFIGVPVLGALLTAFLGRKLGSLATGGAAGGLAWLFGGSLLLAGAAALLALVLVGVLGIGSAGRRGRGGRGGFGGPPIIFPGGGWGGGGGGGFGGGGGGFGSGGGGDFGGGGASGNW